MSITKKDLAVYAARAIRNSGYRKTIDIPKHKFTISDEEGNKHDFVVSGKTKEVTLDEDDTMAVIEAIRECIWETLSKGDKIKIHGIGSLGIKYRRGGRTRSFETGELIEVPDRYTPNFVPSEKLKLIARANGPSVAPKPGRKTKASVSESESD